jgi:8-oxo-dGTP diphosphatase
MGKAVRAIIIRGDRMLVMQRNKYGSQYFTLVGGRINEGETPEQALVREVYEETGLTVTAGRPVFIENHPEPYNEQEIYLCEVNADDAAVQEDSEEGEMNRYGANVHQPAWISLSAFHNLPFRTPLLHQAILHALRKGFPEKPMVLQEAPAPLLQRVKKQLRKKFR